MSASRLPRAAAFHRCCVGAAQFALQSFRAGRAYQATPRMHMRRAPKPFWARRWRRSAGRKSVAATAVQILRHASVRPDGTSANIVDDHGQLCKPSLRDGGLWLIPIFVQGGSCTNGDPTCLLLRAPSARDICHPVILCSSMSTGSRVHNSSAR